MARLDIKDAFFEQMERELERFIDPKTGKVRAEYVERIPCPLCGTASFDHLFIKNGLDFVRCQRCTFVYVNPRFREDIVLEGYTGEEQAESNRIWKEVLLSPEQSSFNDAAFSFLLDRLQEVVPAGKLLDVGCSVGHFMDVANARGFDCEGIEIEPEALAHARNKGYTVYDKKLDNLALPDGSYDAVALLGLIEHLPNPVPFMREVRRILKPGGAVIINGLPNVESAAVMMLRERARTFNGRNHLGYYSPRTLEFLFSQTGFRTSYYGTYVTALDSILNAGQFTDPFANVTLDHVPEKFRAFIESGRTSLEERLISLDLGYKLRAIAQPV